MPFILRGVNLLGINSVYVPMERRKRVWGRLASDLRPGKLSAIGPREVSLDEREAVFDDYIGGRVTGRTVVKLGDE